MIHCWVYSFIKSIHPIFVLLSVAHIYIVAISDGEIRWGSEALIARTTLEVILRGLSWFSPKPPIFSVKCAPVWEGVGSHPPTISHALMLSCFNASTCHYKIKIDVWQLNLIEKNATTIFMIRALKLSQLISLINNFKKNNYCNWKINYFHHLGLITISKRIK